MKNEEIIIFLLIALFIYLIYNKPNFENFVTEADAKESKRLADIATADAKRTYENSITDAATKKGILEQRTKELTEATQAFNNAKSKADATEAELAGLNAELAKMKATII
jgi:hypothetical protein